MNKKNKKQIKNNTFIKFPFNSDNNKCGNILLCGYLVGLFGNITKDEETGKYDFSHNNHSTEDFKVNFTHNIKTIKKAIKTKSKIDILCLKKDNKYFENFFSALFDSNWLYREKLEKEEKEKIYKQFRYLNYDKYINKLDKVIKEMNKKEKYDVIVLNPPYGSKGKGSQHLKFFDTALDKLSDNGKLVIVEPATWLIDVRKNSRDIKLYDEIKRKIEGHVESVVIENLNKEFNIEQHVPCSITTIDMSKKFETIDFVCCGEHKIVNSLYDCNLIGNYNMLWSIIDKCKKINNFMKDHITDKEIGDDMWYAKYLEIGRCGCSSGDRAHLDSYYYGQTFKYFYFNGFDNRDPISNNILKTKDSGNKNTNKNAMCVYGTKKEIENWEHFNMKNKLSLFINYIFSIDQNNKSKEFLPWLVDKKYTDEEINEMFSFTDEEIKLIDTTLKKYERNSPWFKRYMCGVENSATNEEIQNFINEISK